MTSIPTEPQARRQPSVPAALPASPAGEELTQPRPLRLLTAPPSEPPYDDELPASGRPALRLVSRSTTARTAPAPPVLPAADAPVPGALEAAGPFARALVVRLVEVLGGVRPVSQLQRDTSPDVFGLLSRYVAHAPRATGPRAPGRAVHSVHVQLQPGGVAEVCATVVRGGRLRALALRLDLQQGRWCCTELLGL